VCSLGRMKIIIQKIFVFYHVVYSRRYYDCVHHGLVICVLTILETCVNFTGLKVENHFCGRKLFTCRKLTGFKSLLQFVFFFNKIWTQARVLRTVNTAIAFHIPTHTHTHTQNQTQSLYIYIYIYFKIITGFREEISVSVMRRCM